MRINSLAIERENPGILRGVEAILNAWNKHKWFRILNDALFQVQRVCRSFYVSDYDLVMHWLIEHVEALFHGESVNYTQRWLI